jgi:hypothetical protein
MLILTPVILLIITSLVLTVMLFWRPKIGIIWFIAVISAFLTWLIVLFLRLRMPETFSIGSSESNGIFPFITSFRLDKVSWPYAWAITASLLACTLTAVVGLATKAFSRADWVSLPASLVFGGLGLCSVFSGNLNTLLLSWAAFDLLWLFIMLGTNQDHQAIVLAFAIRSAGIFLAIAMAFTQPAGTPLTFPTVDAVGNTILFMAALIRLGSFSVSERSIDQTISNQAFHRFSTIVIASSAFIVITRGSGEILPSLVPLLLGLASIVALLCSLIGLIQYQEPSISWLWIGGMASLVVISALIGEPEASLAWGIALILSGSLFFFMNFIARTNKFLFLLGFLGLSTLPFTPTWQGIRIYPVPGAGSEGGFAWMIWLLAQSFLLVCFSIAMLKPRPSQPATDRWAYVIPPIGLSLLPLTQFTILVIGVPGLTNDLEAFPTLALALFSLVSIALAVIGVRFYPRTPRVSTRISTALNKITPYDWVTHSIGWFFAWITQFVEFIEQLIEGRGGILWTLLFVLLLFALWIQFGAGG